MALAPLTFPKLLLLRCMADAHPAAGLLVQLTFTDQRDGSRIHALAGPSDAEGAMKLTDEDLRRCAGAGNEPIPGPSADALLRALDEHVTVRPLNRFLLRALQRGNSSKERSRSDTQQEYAEGNESIECAIMALDRLCETGTRTLSVERIPTFAEPFPSGAPIADLVHWRRRRFIALLDNGETAGDSVGRSQFRAARFTFRSTPEKANPPAPVVF